MPKMAGELERRIITGLIVSDNYIRDISRVWDARYLQSSMAKRLALWCFEYFEKYSKAPGRDIAGIYIEKLKQGMPKDVAEEIEEDILPGLSEEYEQAATFNVEYLLDQTRSYFKERHLQLHAEEIQALIDTGEPDQAEATAAGYKSVIAEVACGLDLASEEAAIRMENAFNQELQRVITFPGALGEMWNDQFIRGAFVALMAPEKRGKTFRLLDIGIRAVRCRADTAFFQAGDMTEGQQLKRIGVYLARKSDRKRYCGRVMVPVRDCVLNQTDECVKVEREVKMGVLGNITSEDYFQRITYDDLKDAFDTYGQEYQPCHNCPECMGTLWYKPTDIKEPLTAAEANAARQRFFNENKNHFKLSSHVNGTLSVKGIRAVLDVWEKQDGFVPDVVIVDYADLLTTDYKMEFRHQQDHIWQQLRALSQERHCLVVTATQADAKSYVQDTLNITNFSEDKRKLAHVTAMYGLNQDRAGREKALGLMRINELVVREGDSAVNNQVYVMQCLQIGRPFLGSFKKVWS